MYTISSHTHIFKHTHTAYTFSFSADCLYIWKTKNTRTLNKNRTHKTQGRSKKQRWKRKRQRRESLHCCDSRLMPSISWTCQFGIVSCLRVGHSISWECHLGFFFLLQGRRLIRYLGHTVLDFCSASGSCMELVMFRSTLAQGIPPPRAHPPAESPRAP